MINDPVAVKTPGATGASYVEWSAVLAGTVLAASISIVLLQFGSAVGLAVTTPLRGEDWRGSAGIVATGLWVLWTQVTASIAGGYLAGRLRAPVGNSSEHEREIRDGAHGLLVWATGTVAVFAAVSAAGALAALVRDDAADTGITPTVSEQNAIIIFAFIAASVSLVSGVAAWWAATMGGDHRDKSVDYSHFVSFRKR